MSYYAFVSYKTADKRVAGRLKGILAAFEISSFLAHDDISVSDEWRLRILREIAKADVFICFLSKNYFKSTWCIQESGIAAFRKNLPIIPLSLDGTKPRGFIANLQSVKVGKNSITIEDLIPAFLKHDFAKGIDILIEQVCASRNYRDAETNFRQILPYVSRMKHEQIKLLLKGSAENDQIYHASLCAGKYIPPLLKSHGRFLDRKTRALLTKVCARYSPKREKLSV